MRLRCPGATPFPLQWSLSSPSVVSLSVGDPSEASVHMFNSFCFMITAGAAATNDDDYGAAAAVVASAAFVYAAAYQ